MAYLTTVKLKKMGFKSLGNNVKISEHAAVYNPETIEIGNNSRIDDFCIISGNIRIGDYCHITPMCLLAGGIPGIHMDDFCTLAYGVKIFSQSDDYSGVSLVNSLIPKQYKNEIISAVHLNRHVIIGAGSMVFPGVNVAEGCSIGAMTLVNKSTMPWGIYVGNPAKRLKDRKQDLLILEQEFLKSK